MNEQITLLAQLAAIDANLDELHDELGDLPQDVKSLEQIVRQKSELAESTRLQLDELEHLKSNSHIMMQELHDKEVKLSEQQFQVKNNREFDAITKEIDHVKMERAVLDEKLRTSAVKHENLSAQLEIQQAELNVARDNLKEKEQELELLTGDHNEELKKFIDHRLKVIAKLDDSIEAEYERIRTFHREAAVCIKRNSCSGCFSAIPSQRIMEMKYNRDKMYTCENCGRILYTEDIQAGVDAMVEEGNL
ncbi:MAG: hypothetical protein HYX66_00355 [Ignavibacteria bacterium]|nr:hypothetical protein [Ignavibacteria bacterium]